ncbi:MAG: tetratricopeptide repeat protein [Chloroherpetonaceae bacterium]
MSQISAHQLSTAKPLNAQPSSVETIEKILASSPTQIEAIAKLNRMAKQLIRKDAQTALQYAHKARELAEKLQQKNLLAEAFVNTGNAYYHLARYDKALDHSYRALKLFDEFDKTEPTPTKAVAMQIIGCVNLHLGENDQAYHYFTQAAEILEEAGDQLAYSNALMNIGSVYFQKGNYQEALAHYFKTLSIREENGDRSGVAEVMANIGATYHSLGDSEEGIDWLKKSLESAKAEENVSVQITTLINLGEVYAAVNRDYKAIDALLDSIALADGKAEHKQYLWSAYLNLANTYKKIEKYQEALEAYEQYVQIKEKILGIEAERKIKAIELNHAIEKAKRDAEMELAHKKIKKLEEIVTMCAWSGKIQMDGKWVKIEQFLEKRFGIRVSHGISEEEAEKVFKQIDKENQGRTDKAE